MEKLLGLLLLPLSVFGASAQSQANADYENHNRVVNVNAEVRVDFQQDYLGEDLNKANSGFKGKYLVLALDGHINKHFYYAFRQRLNTYHENKSFFDATEWVYLSYRPNEHWDISAGKQVVGIGGFEYDRSPIDLYFNSEYWNNIACYQFGASVTYAIGDGSDRIMAQVCESPFAFNHQEYMFAYNLIWYCKHDWFNTIYSVNMTEYSPEKYIYYIVLGNEFKFGDFKLQLDFMNRGTEGNLLFQDFSIMGEASYMIKDKVNVFGKATYDVNDGVEGDYCVMPGTELNRVGGGIEYYPLSKGRKDLRLFAHYSYSWGVNGNPGGAIKDNQHFWGVGLKWDMNILSINK